jgi:hypothetical protein
MATSLNGREVPSVVGMKVSNAAEGPSLGDLLQQIEAGELSADEAAELLDATISDLDDVAMPVQHTQLDMLLDQIQASVMEASGVARAVETLRESLGFGEMARSVVEASGISRIAEMASEVAGTGTLMQSVMETSGISRIARELADLGRRGRRKIAGVLEAVADRIEARRPGSRLPWWLRRIAAFARRNRSTWPPVRQARAGSRPRPDYLTAQPPPGRCVSSSPRKVRGPNPRTDVLVHPRVAAA